MTRLENEIIGKIRGFVFCKIHEEFDEQIQKWYYIYEQKEKASDINAYSFEVFTPKIRREPQLLPNNTWAQPGELYPGANDFGNNALSIGGVYGKRREDGLVRAHQAILELKQRDLKNLSKKKSHE